MKYVEISLENLYLDIAGNIWIICDTMIEVSSFFNYPAGRYSLVFYVQLLFKSVNVEETTSLTISN